MLVLGGREAEARTVSVRRHGGVDAGVKPLDEGVAEAAAESRHRRLTRRRCDPDVRVTLGAFRSCVAVARR